MDRRDVLRGALVGSGALASSALLAACSPAGTTAPSPGPSGSPRRGGTLRVGLAGGGSGDTVDAHVVNTAADGARIGMLYDQLTQVDNTFTLQHTLAESVTPNATADQWTVRLRDGVEFHNGKTLDADDVIFSLRRLFDPKLAAFGGLQLQSVDTKNLKKVDARTVLVPLKQPASTFDVLLGDGHLCSIVPVDYDPKKPVGTGPFKFKSFTPGQQSTFERFANYWGKPALLDTLVLTDISDDAARVNALISGQVDAATQIPFAQLPVIEQNTQLRLLESKNGSFQPLMMRSDTGPFKDKRMRQALRLVVDREQAVKVALAGHGVVANDLYSPYDKAFDSGLKRTRDVAKAKQLLQEAGYDGSTIELTASPLAAGLTEWCSVVVQNAKEAGLNLVVRTVDPGTLFGGGQTFPLAVNTWPSVSYLTTASVADVFPGNGAGYNNEAYRNLFQQAEATLDPTKRGQLQQQMQQILFDEGPYLIPYFPNTIDAYNASFAGWLKEDLTGIGMPGMFASVYKTA